MEQDIQLVNYKYKDSMDLLRDIERIGRVCYKSEHRITSSSAAPFVRSIIERGHESVLEHISITVRFITDRAIANELVRHRIAAYSQESTRYCNYKDKIEFIYPKNVSDKQLQLIMEACACAATTYQALIADGATPEVARDVLPLCTKTELIATYNLREWRHILRLRTDKAAHPKMRELMQTLLQFFQGLVPIIFDDI